MEDFGSLADRLYIALGGISLCAGFILLGKKRGRDGFTGLCLVVGGSWLLVH